MQLHKIAFAALAVFASSSAFAADLPPPPMAPVQAPAAFLPAPLPYNWTGWYIGGNLGWGWSNVNLTDVGPGFPPGAGQVFPLGSTTNFSQNGFLGGGQLGFNYQINQWVVGLEGDFDYTAIDNKQSGNIGPITFNQSYKDPWTATVAARFGWAFDRVLVYGKAGGAWMQEKYNTTASDGSQAGGTFSRWGWTVGAGVEYGITNYVTAKVEYDFMDFGDQNQNLTANSIDQGTGTITGDTNKSSLNASVVKAGINVLLHP
jgi:outer membrane immunogenic protein